MKKWSKQEDEFLISNFPGADVDYISGLLGRSLYEVKCRVIYLKIDSEMIFKTVKSLING